MEAGREIREEMGTIRLQTAQEVCFTKGEKERYEAEGIPRWSLYDLQHEILVLRPLNVIPEGRPLTENARARVTRPGLKISRTCDASPYHDVPIGGNLTYTVTVENCAHRGYTDIPILQELPQGTRLVQTAGARRGQTLSWCVSVPAGGSVQARFTVAVEKGPEVCCRGGTAAGIALPELTRYVGRFAGEETPDVPKLLECHLETLEDGSGLVRFSGLPRQLVPGFLGGRRLVTASAAERILDFRTEFLMPGDILVTVADPLGPQQQVTLQRQEDVTEEMLWGLFAKELFFLMRPGR